MSKRQLNAAYKKYPRQKNGIILEMIPRMAPPCIIAWATIHAQPCFARCVPKHRIEMRVAPVLNYMELTLRFKPRAERQPCNAASAYPEGNANSGINF